MGMIKRMLVYFVLHGDGFIPCIREGHWCYGNWNNYIKGNYVGSIIKFDKRVNPG
jgi:hypothetical protein